MTIYESDKRVACDECCGPDPSPAARVIKFSDQTKMRLCKSHLLELARQIQQAVMEVTR